MKQKEKKKIKHQILTIIYSKNQANETITPKELLIYLNQMNERKLSKHSIYRYLNELEADEYIYLKHDADTIDCHTIHKKGIIYNTKKPLPEQSSDILYNGLIN